MQLALMSIGSKMRNLVVREDGQDVAEVGLLLLLIMTGSVAILSVLSNEVALLLNSFVGGW